MTTSGIAGCTGSTERGSTGTGSAGSAPGPRPTSWPVSTPRSTGAATRSWRTPFGGGWFESVEAHRLDAFLDLARPDSAAPAGPANMVHVVVDYDALMRGHTVPGEPCEIPGIGPIPVSVARRLSEDAFLKVLLTKGVDVVGVAHGGKMIPTHLRTALEIRDPKCIVPR